MATGRCLCGGVRYRVDGDLAEILHCHCENCRRLTGNFIAAARARTDELVVDDDSSLRWYDLGYARYGFCVNCGSTLFYVASDRQDLTAITAGTLDDVSDLRLGAVWYTAEAQPHNVLPDDVPHHPGDG